MNQGPWLFRKFVVVIIEYDGLCDLADVVSDRTAVWAQIHSIPELYNVVKNPTYLSQFIPITLCNVVFKIVSKVLAN
jgi:hypothetical protein